MIPEFFYGIDLWVLFLGMLICFPISVYMGHRLGERKRRVSKGNSLTQSETISTAILGLLALLLGFTFSMSLDRYEERRNLVVEEANAIETAYLRTSLISGKESDVIRGLLKKYVDLRLEYFYQGRESPRLAEILGQTQEVHNSLWRSLERAAAIDRSPIMALLINTTNEIIDLHSKRVASMENHVPEIVYYLILIAMLIALINLSHALAVDGRRGYFGLTALSLLLSLAFLVIADLDRPRRGIIRVSQNPLIELQRKWK